MTTDSLDAALEAFNAEHRYHPLIAALNTARGQRYGQLLRQVLADIGSTITADALAVTGGTRGNMTPVDIGVLCLRYGLSFKVTCEHLEETGSLWTGTHERIHNSGVKVKEIMAAAKERLCALHTPPA